MSDILVTALIAAGAVLAGASLSLLGTWRSNVNSRRQLRMQLDHDALQRDKERWMAMRRDVYLPAAESVMRAQGLLSQLSSPDTDLSVVTQQLQSELATLAKVHVVGRQETVRAVMEFLQALMPAYLDLAKARTDLVVRKQMIATNQTLMDRASEDMQRFIEMMKQHNLAGSVDQAQWSRISEQYKAARDTLQECAANHAALSQQQQVDLIALAERATTLALALSEKIPTAILAAREELGLPLDEQEYRRMYSEQQEAARRHMADVMADVRRRIQPVSH
jgi:hypothetical protein